MDPFVRTIERESEMERAKKYLAKESRSRYFCAVEVWIAIARRAEPSAHSAGAAQSPAATRLTLTAKQVGFGVRWEAFPALLPARRQPPPAHPPAAPLHQASAGRCGKQTRHPSKPPADLPKQPSQPRTDMTVEKQSRTFLKSGVGKSDVEKARAEHAL